MKKLITLLLSCLIGYSSTAQDLDSLLKREIFTYYDSNRIVLNNSRKMVFKYIEKNDPARVEAIIKYVERRLNPYIYRVFTNDEKELINFFIGNYETILLEPKVHYSRYGFGGCIRGNYYGDYGIQYPDVDFRYSNNLNVVIALHAENIIEKIAVSEISEEEKAFLTLYFKYIIDLEEDLSMEAVKFIHEFPQSTYVNFVKENIRRWYVRGDYSWDIYLGGGQSLLSGEINKTISHQSTVMYGIDGSLNRAMIGIRMATSYGDVLNEFSHRGDVFTEGMPIYSFNYNLSVGYSLLDLDFLRVTPTVDFGGIFTSVPEHKTEEFPEDPSVGAISYGFGGTMDIFPFHFVGTYDNSLHRIGLRIHGGRFYNNLSNKNALLDGHQDYIGLSIIYDGGLMKIDMD